MFGQSSGRPAETGQTETTAAPTLQNSPQLPMKWYKFVIYFTLFASALIDLGNAVSYFRGTVYGDVDTIAAVYYIFPSMKPLDIIIGIALIGMAVFSIYTRFALAGFKRIALPCFYSIYIINIVALLLYVGIASTITGINLLSGKLIGNLIGCVAYLLINYRYFSKRKDMFNR